MDIKDFKVGMKVRCTLYDMGIGTITAIGRDIMLATFPSRDGSDGIEQKIEPFLYEEFKEDTPHTYTVTLNSKDNKTISAVFMKDGIVVGTESVTAANPQDFDLKDGMSICLETLLENIEL